MAKKATIYRAHLDLSLVDRNVYEERLITVARHPSETTERMVMRILAFALRCDDGLEFGRGISTDDEPDLWRREGDGRVHEWIEVGQPDAKRLLKASRVANACRLFVFGDGSGRYRAGQLESLGSQKNLSIARIDDAFVRAVAATCERQIRWSFTASDGDLFLGAGDATFETRPEIWQGDPLG